MSGTVLGIFSVLMGAAGGFLVGWAASEYKMIKRIERAIHERENIPR